jgi:hypothetical protein
LQFGVELLALGLVALRGLGRLLALLGHVMLLSRG